MLSCLVANCMHSLFVVRSESVLDCRGAGSRSRGAAGVPVDIPPVSGFAGSTDGWGAQVTPAASGDEPPAAVPHAYHGLSASLTEIRARAACSACVALECKQVHLHVSNLAQKQPGTEKTCGAGLFTAVSSNIHDSREEWLSTLSDSNFSLGCTNDTEMPFLQVHELHARQLTST